MGNTGADKYDFTAKQIQKFQISTFFVKCKMTFRKVTPATKLVNEKKLSQAQMTPWHVPSSIWVLFGLWWLIFLVKNQFVHIFPVLAWSPYQSLFLRYEVENGLKAVCALNILHWCSPYKQMTLSEIYLWIMSTFPYYKANRYPGAQGHEYQGILGNRFIILAI